MRYDTKTLNATPLESLIGHELKRGGNWLKGSCPFCGGDDRFNIKVRENVWLCRKCTDEKYKDVITFVMMRENVDFRSACQVLTDGTFASASTLTTKPTKKATKPQIPRREWEEMALPHVLKFMDLLQDGYEKLERDGVGNDSPSNVKAASYLTKRGIDASTAAMFWLGYCPKGERIGQFGEQSYYVHRGISIPSFSGKDYRLRYLKFRVFRKPTVQADGTEKKAHKYISLSGSKTASIFNANLLLEADVDTAVIVEGEFDCMLLSRFAPPNVAVITMGSAGSVPNKHWQGYLSLLQRAYYCLDTDDSGIRGAKKWGNLVEWAEPLPLPQMPNGKNDITDFWTAGGDLAQWLTDGLSAPRLEPA